MSFMLGFDQRLRMLWVKCLIDFGIFSVGFLDTLLLVLKRVAKLILIELSSTFFTVISWCCLRTKILCVIVNNFLEATTLFFDSFIKCKFVVFSIFEVRSILILFLVIIFKLIWVEVLVAIIIRVVAICKGEVFKVLFQIVLTCFCAS